MRKYCLAYYLFFTLLSISCSNKKEEVKKRANEELGSVASIPSSEKVVAITEDPIVAKEETSNLELKTILRGRVGIEIPKGFSPMSEEMFNLKYPSKDKEKVIVFSNEEGSINILVEYTKDIVPNGDLTQFKDSFSQRLVGLNLNLTKNEIQKINNRDVIIFEFISPALDGEVYNLMFATYLEDRLLIGTFNCKDVHVKEWKPIGEKIVRSVKIL